MRSIHSIRAVATAALARWLHRRRRRVEQQPIVAPALQERAPSQFTTFLRGAPIGTEQVALTAYCRRLDDCGHRAARRANRRRRRRRCRSATPPTGGRSSSRFDATVRGQAQTIRTTVRGHDGDRARSAPPARRTREERHHRRRPRAGPARTASSALTRRSPRGCNRPAPGTDIPIYSVPAYRFTDPRRRIVATSRFRRRRA